MAASQQRGEGGSSGRVFARAERRCDLGLCRLVELRVVNQPRDFRHAPGVACRRQRFHRLPPQSSVRTPQKRQQRLHGPDVGEILKRNHGCKPEDRIVFLQQPHQSGNAVRIADSPQRIRRASPYS